jgi:hypothetical protein
MLTASPYLLLRFRRLAPNLTEGTFYPPPLRHVYSIVRVLHVSSYNDTTLCYTLLATFPPRLGNLNNAGRELFVCARTHKHRHTRRIRRTRVTVLSNRHQNKSSPFPHRYYSDTSDPLTRASPNAKYGETSELRAMTS